MTIEYEQLHDRCIIIGLAISDDTFGSLFAKKSARIKNLMLIEKQKL